MKALMRRAPYVVGERAAGGTACYRHRGAAANTVTPGTLRRQICLDGSDTSRMSSIEDVLASEAT